MPALERVNRAFAQIESPLGDVSRYVAGVLRPFCESHSFLFSERTKTAESLTEKLESGRYKSWSDIDDLYACTIVVPIHEEKDVVVGYLDSMFNKELMRSSSDTLKAPDVFRFDATRWYGTLPGDEARIRQPDVSLQLFEVQVVTAFEYAWSSVTHSLIYKSDTVDWRRLRLAAQLKAAVEQVEVLISAFESASSAVLESPWQETETKARIVSEFKRFASDGVVPEILLPASWRRFAVNVFALVCSYEKNRSKRDESVSRLLVAAEAELYDDNSVKLPQSGTLFQFVLFLVTNRVENGNIKNFTVIDSGELRDLYGVLDIPRPFCFD